MRLNIDRPSHMPIEPPIAAINDGTDQTHCCCKIRYSNDPQFRLIIVKSVML